MAEVWEAHDQVLGRRVAVKVLHPALAADPTFLERLRREATASASINHPSMVPIYDAGADGTANYLVMEYLEGITLADHLEQGPLELRQVVDVGIAMAGALEAVHRAGLVHRDVKPANIMVTPDNGVKLMDLGIARGPDAASLTATDSMIGTANYVSPEQAKGQPADARSDVYGLGCVLFEAATGRLPFEGDTPVAVAIQHISAAPPVPSSIDPHLPGLFDSIIARSLAKDPDQRYPSARDMAADLRALASGEVGATAVAPVAAAGAPTAVLGAQTAPSPAPTVTTREHPGVSRRRRSPVPWLVAGLALVGIALALVAAEGAGLFDTSDDTDAPVGTDADAPPDDTDSPDATDGPPTDDTDPPVDATEPTEPTDPTDAPPDPAGAESALAAFRGELDRVLADGQIDQSARDGLVDKASDAVTKARDGDDDALDDVAAVREDLADLTDELDAASYDQLRRLVDRLEQEIAALL